MQDLKPKHVKKKFKKASNMMPKTSKNEGPNLSKSSLGGLWGPLGALLGASWVPLGPKIRKKLRGIRFLGLNLGAKMDEKSQKIGVKKKLILAYVFFILFLQFCIGFGP